jgi:hypothetical protein
MGSDRDAVSMVSVRITLQVGIDNPGRIAFGLQNYATLHPHPRWLGIEPDTAVPGLEQGGSQHLEGSAIKALR